MLGGTGLTKDDKYALREFMRGVSFTIVVAGIAMLGIVLLSGGEDVSISKPSAEVVGTYKDCDIIQWHYGALAEYKYFLYCGDK